MRLILMMGLVLILGGCATRGQVTAKLSEVKDLYEDLEATYKSEKAYLEGVFTREQKILKESGDRVWQKLQELYDQFQEAYKALERDIKEFQRQKDGDTEPAPESSGLIIDTGSYTITPNVLTVPNDLVEIEHPISYPYEIETP